MKNRIKRWQRLINSSRQTRKTVVTQLEITKPATPQIDRFKKNRNKLILRTCYRISWLIVGLIFIVGLGWGGRRFILVNKVKCQIENGVCSAALEYYLSELKGRYIFSGQDEIKLEIAEKFPLYDRVEIRLKWPGRWIITGVLRQPAAMIELKAKNEISQTITVDKDGVILGNIPNDNLPVLQLNPLGFSRTSARWTDKRVVDSLLVLIKFNQVTDLTMQTLQLSGNQLVLTTAGGLTVVFDPEKDPDKQLDSLQAILGTARIKNNQMGKTIDLTNARPVVF